MKKRNTSSQTGVPPSPSRRTWACTWKKLLVALPIAIALVLYHLPTIMDEYEAWYGYGDARVYDLPPGVMDQFRVYDVNGDGYLDPYEFVPLGLRLREEVKITRASPPCYKCTGI